MFDINKIIAKPGTKINLSDFKTDYSGKLEKEDGKKVLKEVVEELSELQELLYADNRYSVLVVFQAPDAGGKDGAIRSVFSGVNPQGCQVTSFRSPSKVELEHDYLWRHVAALPEKGVIGIFNRSHYENVLVTKVNPDYLMGEKIPGYETVDKINEKFWQTRYEQINNFEKFLSQNGTIVIKFFLNISKEEQKDRFLSRLEETDKYWKFNSGDLDSRDDWDKYRTAYQEMLQNTSTDYAPWYVIPSDKKFFARVAIGKIINDRIKAMNMKFPAGEGKEQLDIARKRLENE